jgi:outer membrane protein OmpA-like peptidoglycan-associated protein
LKKVLLTSVASLFSVITLNAGDCIMAKDLNVEFANDSTNYETHLERVKIEEYAKFLKESDLYSVIEGHTNHYAPAKYNYELSVKRAEKVKNELISLGVEPNKIKALGFGESAPLYSKNDAEGVEKNRRVVAEIFNSEEELNRYINTAKTNIAAKRFVEQ